METKEELREFISNLEDELLWISFALIKKELKNRDLVRTKNIVGERGEKVAIKFYNDTPNLPKLVAAPEGTRNVDALSRNGERYSIKTITHPTTKKTGVFYGLNPPDSNVEDDRLFEYVIIVKLDDELELVQILELDWPLFQKRKRWDKRMLAWFLSLTKALEEDATIIYQKTNYP